MMLQIMVLVSERVVIYNVKTACKVAGKLVLHNKTPSPATHVKPMFKH